MAPMIIDTLPALRLEDVRKTLGGKRRFRKLAQEGIQFQLPDGRFFHVEITTRPGNLGGQILYFSCPTCGRPCRTLRITAFGLACYRDLQHRLGAKFESQIVSNRDCGEKGTIEFDPPEFIQNVSLSNTGGIDHEIEM